MVLSFTGICWQKQDNPTKSKRQQLALNKARLLSSILAVLGLLASLPLNAWVITETQEGTYSSPSAALQEMADRFLSLSRRQDVEYVGGLLRLSNGAIKVTAGAGSRGEDRVRFRVSREPGSEIVGFWHTHGDHGFARNLFSSTDADMVRSTGKPLYLITPNGALRVLTIQNLKKKTRNTTINRRQSGLFSRFDGYPGLKVARSPQK